jgi:hypothetical protein
VVGAYGEAVDNRLGSTPSAAAYASTEDEEGIDDRQGDQRGND